MDIKELNKKLNEALQPFNSATRPRLVLEYDGKVLDKWDIDRFFDGEIDLDKCNAYVEVGE